MDFQETTYRTWERKIQVLSSQGRKLDTSHGVLLVQGLSFRISAHGGFLTIKHFSGKPGYGKTVFCAKLIERSTSSQPFTGQQRDVDSEESPMIGLIFFDGLQEMSTHPN